MNPVQIKELEDGLAAARQSSAHLQTQLDAASTSAHSQAVELTSAQAEISQLGAECESLQSQLTEAQSAQTAAKETAETQEAAAADKQRQWAIKVHAWSASRLLCCNRVSQETCLSSSMLSLLS